VSGFFGLKYRNAPIEDWFGVHPALKDSHTWSDDGWFAEFKTMKEFGKLESEWFKQDRLTRMLYVGGLMAEGALQAMESFDRAEEQKMKAEAERKARGR
jgi:hypothetical protein